MKVMISVKVLILLCFVMNVQSNPLLKDLAEQAIISVALLSNADNKTPEMEEMYIKAGEISGMAKAFGVSDYESGTLLLDSFKWAAKLKEEGGNKKLLEALDIVYSSMLSTEESVLKAKKYLD